MISQYYFAPVGRHCEERSDEAIQEDLYGLPRRFAPRNDGLQGLEITTVFCRVLNGEGQ